MCGWNIHPTICFPTWDSYGHCVLELPVLVGRRRVVHGLFPTSFHMLQLDEYQIVSQ